MKYCGCTHCRNNGERNLYEEFDRYYDARASKLDDEFHKIFMASYDVGEMQDLYDELDSKFEDKNLQERINAYGKVNRTGPGLGIWKY